ncbi:MAG TPA: choice-of-anchor tandem repeat GloVer-containing protein [Verrucomicrobiae bacterium]|jgi:uncharacterized repeat protein (TIGR03803 family)
MKRRLSRLCAASLVFLSAICFVRAQSAGFKVLHNFSAAPNSTNKDGSFPSGLALEGGTLYGTAEYSGAGGVGGVFSINVNGTGFSALYSFTALPASAYPFVNGDGANPESLAVSGGMLYGTAQQGGTSGYGAVFALDSDGTGFTNLCDFTSNTNGAGSFPAPSLILSGNTLYGTAEQGGRGGNGTVFAINTDGSGFTSLHSFSALQNGTNRDGAYPQDGLVLEGNTLYGTASGGGGAGGGTVFSVNINGTGFAVLHSFTPGSLDDSGNFTNGDGLTPEAGLAVSSNTLYGTASGGGSAGNGTVFSVNTDSAEFAVLHNFSATFEATNGDGSTPDTALTLSGAALYGTASDGGTDGSGTLFAISISGANFSVLHTFTGGSDGADPHARLIFAGNMLYGAAAEGGATGSGTIFSLQAGAIGRPVITNEPAAQTVVSAGATATLQVGATGDGTLAYQWHLNGRNVAGATASILTLKNVTASSAGSYQAVVANSAGSVTSTVAIVTVLVPPAIAAQPANASVATNGIAKFSIKASGAPLVYQWFFNGQPLADGGNIIGSATNLLTINLVTAANAGTYFAVVSNSAAGVTSKPVQLTLIAEKTKPVVAITSPKLNSRTNAPVLSGTASDLVRVQAVSYWLTNVNNGVSTLSAGLADLAAGSGAVSNWAIAAVPLPGTNILVVQSSNYSGQVSLPARVRFFYRLASPLQVQINPPGLGTVTGGASVVGDPAPSAQSSLYIGERYTLTAKPAKNCWLTNWTSDDGVAGTNLSLGFIMEPNLSVITANFATNLFVGAAARYDGIFFPSSPDAGSETNSGLIYNLVLGSNGVYSGKLYLASGVPHVLAGAFNRSGQAVEVIKRTALAGGNVTLNMSLLWPGAPRLITGSVQGSNWVSPNLTLCAATTNKLPHTNYTMLLPQDASVADAPPGYGYAMLTNISGMIHAGGALADGTAFTPLIEPVNEMNQVPVYASLYLNTGLALGNLSLDDANDVANPAADLLWFKPRQKTGLYTNGFDTDLLAALSPWTNAASFGGPLQLTFAGGGLASNLVFTVQITKPGTYGLVSGPTNFISGTINAAGKLVFSFYDTSGHKVTANGAALADIGAGGGFFSLLKATNSGTFTLGDPSSLRQFLDDQLANLIINEASGGPPQPAEIPLLGQGPPPP